MSMLTIKAEKSNKHKYKHTHIHTHSITDKNGMGKVHGREGERRRV